MLDAGDHVDNVPMPAEMRDGLIVGIRPCITSLSRARKCAATIPSAKAPSRRESSSIGINQWHEMARQTATRLAQGERFTLSRLVATETWAAPPAVPAVVSAKRCCSAPDRCACGHRCRAVSHCRDDPPMPRTCSCRRCRQFARTPISPFMQAKVPAALRQQALKATVPRAAFSRWMGLIPTSTTTPGSNQSRPVLENLRLAGDQESARWWWQTVATQLMLTSDEGGHSCDAGVTRKSVVEDRLTARPVPTLPDAVGAATAPL